MISLNIFDDDAFSVTSLSDSIETGPYKPRLLGSLGLFTDKPIRTTTAYVEKKGGKLSILSTANRGTVKNVKSRRDREMVPFKVPHIPYFSEILADDVQNVRAKDSESELEAVATIVNEELLEMKEDHEVTTEWQRVGALKGEIIDGDGTSVIVNLFDEFEVTQTVINWSTTDANLTSFCTEVIRTMADILGNITFSNIIGICGDEYFDNFVIHSSVTSAYDRWRDGEYLRVAHMGPEWYSIAANGFQFQNIMFINYRGKIGDTDFIASDEAYFVPMGIPKLFRSILAPADFMETVNTLGQRFYAKQERLRFDKGVELHTQSNALEMCTRPDAIIKSVWSPTESSSSA